jgi:hypothetical protein
LYIFFSSLARVDSSDVWNVYEVVLESVR